ncbi:MAG: ComEC/Rec2 family competence protein [Pseudomonadota bacterium]
MSRIEEWLENERDQIALWLPVALGSGIVLWFILADQRAWIAVMVGACAASLIGFAIGKARRLGTFLLVGGLCVAFGCALTWWRAEFVAAPRLARPAVETFEAQVTRIENQRAKAQSRVWMNPSQRSKLPPLIRVTIKDEDMVASLAVGDTIRLRARLVPPPDALVPGGYDFSRTAWFLGLGASGSAIGSVLRTSPPQPEGKELRSRLSAHVRSQIEGSAGGIAAAFASGDRGGIAPEDEEAMRASGLTHLLSISGLHITAVVAAVLFITLRLLALSPVLALRFPLPLIAAGAGALAGIGYTALTGAEVPTIRSCVAAVLVLIGIAIGREAMTLRLVATGAIIILFLWPEALMGASFQLSFAAITVIVALHENRSIRAMTMRRDEDFGRRLVRGVLSLMLTGLAVELALAPIALFHFHKSGVYGALANIFAIPLTTFVTMPLEALALLFDLVGLGAPFWWLTGVSLDLLLWLARVVAAAPGAVAVVPEMPLGSIALIVGGGLWLLLWKTKICLAGIAPIAIGTMLAMLAPAPDILITGDGRHLAVRSSDGTMHLLRARSGDYVRDVLAERFGTLAPLEDIDVAKGAKCGRDLCVITVSNGMRDWRIAATRSDYLLPWQSFIKICQSVDVIVSSRRLPRACIARWITADRLFLQKTGGLAITLGSQAVERTLRHHDDHPWRRASTPPEDELPGKRQYRRNSPASLP